MAKWTVWGNHICWRHPATLSQTMTVTFLMYKLALSHSCGQMVEKQKVKLDAFKHRFSVSLSVKSFITRVEYFGKTPRKFEIGRKLRAYNFMNLTLDSLHSALQQTWPLTKGRHFYRQFPYSRWLRSVLIGVTALLLWLRRNVGSWRRSTHWMRSWLWPLLLLLLPLLLFSSFFFL